MFHIFFSSSHSKSKHSIKGLAIIDDQSTLSFVQPSISQELSIPQEDLTPETHSTITVQGIQTHESLIIKGLLITSLNGDPSISLDSVRTLRLPHVPNDVPTPQEVLPIPGLSHLAEKFPAKENWPTLMLIGRDCTQAQKHIQAVSSEDNHQLAIQTPLGWTIVGKPAQTTRPLLTCRPYASTSAPTAMPKLSHASASSPNYTPTAYMPPLAPN